MDQQQTYALVTGASRGLGRFFARELSAKGRDLVLVARSSEKLEAIAADLRSKHGIDVEVIVLDLAQPGAGSVLADEIAARSLHIDLLINNAGFGDQNRFLDLSLERQI
ncbi:MAG TPA: SDR family NAD(P)-dependent oxidoreductase, partial [Pyrinomonadaceae bacterium]|nr:SDR family NAD(P)-dependent oxidoreductase [Pyrinomonadaceae bacterium]